MTKIAVREGQLVVPTCPECGCRLEKVSSDGEYIHFMRWSWWVKKDARGCTCTSIKQRFIIIEGKVTPMWAQ